MHKAKSLPGNLDNCCTYDRSLIELLLPHRPPFLMVDEITSYTGGKNPCLLANYSVKDNELGYFGIESDGHWPSIYVVEGLGQACNLLIVIYALEKGLTETDLKIIDMGEVLNKLMHDEPDEPTRILIGFLNQRLMEPYSDVGFLGSADLEITGHARQGQVISYQVQMNQAFGSLFHSSVRAYADNNLIARGTLVSASRKV